MNKKHHFIALFFGQVDLKEGLQTITIHTVEIGQMNYDYIDFKWIK